MDLGHFIDTPLVQSESDFEADSEFSPASGGSTPQFKFLTQVPSPVSIVHDGDPMPVLDLYVENSSQLRLCQSAKFREASQPDPWKPKMRGRRKPFVHQRKH